MTLPAASLSAEPVFNCEKSLRPFVHVQGRDLHNTWQHGNAMAQARQEAGMSTSHSQSGVIGAFAKDEFPRWDSGFTSNREFLVRLHRQTMFSAGEVKPHQKQSLYDIKGESWDAFLGASAHRRLNDQTLSCPPRTASPNSAMSLSASERRPRVQIPQNVKPQDRIRALDWNNFGRRNHVTILRGQHYNTQYRTSAVPVEQPGWSLRPETTTPDRWTRRFDVPSPDNVKDSAAESPNFRTHWLPEATSFGIRPGTEAGMRRRSPGSPTQYWSKAFRTPPNASQFMKAGDFDAPGRVSLKNRYVGRLGTSMPR